MTGVRESGAFTRPCDAPLPHVSRRAVLMAGALVPAAWAVPQVVAVPVAWANPPHSAPPRTPPSETSKPPVPQMGPPLPRDLPGTLPFTGQNAVEHAELGAAALLAGAAVVAVTREKRAVT